jgi:hypothetical protein
MNRFQALAYFILIAEFITQLVMVWLQSRAFQQHKHVSFLLLLVATSCGLLYIVVGQILGLLRDTIFAPPVWVFALVSMLLFAQMIVGVWGTASLFRSYGQLKGTSDAVVDVAANL